MATLKKPPRKEHEVLNYMVALTLAFSLLHKKEEEQLVRMVKDRLENFEKTKLFTRQETCVPVNLRAPPFWPFWLLWRCLGAL